MTIGEAVHDSELLLCGACGIREFQRGDTKDNFKCCPVHDLSPLQLTEEESYEFDAIVNQPPITVPSTNKMATLIKGSVWH